MKTQTEQIGTVPVPKTSSRIVAVDLSRVLAALFIMYSHIQVWNMNSNATNIVGSFLMNKAIGLDTYNCIFFVFAGYFVSRNISWGKAAYSAFWCFAPYLLWNAVAFVAAGLATGEWPPQADRATSFPGLICSYLGMDGRPPMDGPLWFIRDLAVFFLISPIVFRLSGWLFSVSLFFSLYTAYADVINHDYAMNMICSLYSLSFFSLGCFICKLSPELQRKLLRFYSVPMICVYFGLVLVSVICGLFYGPVDLFPDVCQVPFISITVSVWMFYQLCRLLEEKVPCVVVLTKHLAPVAFLVFAAHRIVFSWVLPDSVPGTNWMVLVPIGVFAGSYVLFLLLKRYCRPLLHIVAHYKMKPESPRS